MIETGQIADVTITFFMVNLFMFLLLMIALAIMYFGFNMFKNYSQNSQTMVTIDQKSTNMFHNMFNNIIGQESAANGTTNDGPPQSLLSYSSIETPSTITNQPPLTKQPIERINVTPVPYHNFYGGKSWVKRHSANEILTNGGGGVPFQ
jgi:hypothetical protein